MALLTWRNVEEPNFRASGETARLAADLINRAGTGAESAVSAFDNSIKDKQNSFAVNNVLQYQDADALKQALASGAAFGGVDPTRLTADTLRTGADRVGSLMNQAAAQQTFDHNAEVNADWKDRLDQGKSPEISAYLAAMASGDRSRIAAAGSTLLSKGLRSDVVAPIITTGTAVRGQDLSNQSMQGDITAKEKERADTHAGVTAALGALEIGTGEDALRVLRQKYPNLTPEAQDYAERFIQNRSALEAAANASSAAGTDLNTVATPVYSAYNKLYGGDQYHKASGPLIDMTMRQLGQETEKLRQATVGKIKQDSLGTTAAGAWQLTQTAIKEVAPSVLGKDWQDVKFTPDVQERLAAAYYDKYKGGDLTKKWPSLARIPGASKPGHFNNTSFSQIKEVLAAGEGGFISAPAATRTAGNNATIALQQRLGVLNSNPYAQAVLKYSNDQRDAATIAAELVASKKLGDVTQGDVINMINDIKAIPAAAGVSPAAIGNAILTNALTGTSWWQRVSSSRFGTSGGQDVRLSKQLLTEIAKKLDPETVAAVNLQATETQNLLSSVKNAQDRYNAAQLNLRNMNMRKAGGHSHTDVSRAEEILAASEANLNSVSARVTKLLSDYKAADKAAANPPAPPVPVPANSLFSGAPVPSLSRANSYGGSSL